MIDHISVQCADLPASAAFYDAVLAPLGSGRVMDLGEAIGYGSPSSPDFWIGQQRTGDGGAGPAVGSGHIRSDVAGPGDGDGAVGLVKSGAG